MKSNSYNQKCALNEECDQTQGLFCKQNVCQCKDEYTYWNEKLSKCGTSFFLIPVYNFRILKIRIWFFKYRN